MQNQLIIFAALVAVALVSKLFARRVYVFTKALPIIFILFLAFLKPGTPPAIWLVGLFFGLAGDLFLLSGRGFLPGLLSFLLGHIFYIAAYAQAQPAVPGTGLVLAVAISSLAIYVYFARMLLASRQKKYLVPVLLYVAVTAVLLAKAIQSGILYPSVLGAVLFALSDFLLAFNKFSRQSWYVEAGVSLTYYPAQWLLAAYFAGV
ncbi:MAG: lysoplasmalogenase family protein [Spirochaetota bacterium]